MIIFNAGQLDAVGQEIEWFPTANQATFTEDLYTASFGSYATDVGSIGDGAKTAWTSTYAAIYFSSGQLMEFVHIESETTGSIHASDVQKIAQTAANYINAAGLGS